MQAKIVTMLLSAMLLSTGVTGTQQIKSTDITEPITKESEVKYKQESNFTVTIPKKIALSSGKTAEYAVTVSGSVGANEKVSVTPDNTFTMNEANNRKTAVTGTATQEDTVWNYEQIETSEVKNGNVTASGLTAGDWSGSLTFNINLNAEYAVGNDVELTRDNLEEYSIPTEGDVVIPEMVLGSDGMKHKVTSIGALAFYHNNITSITLPDSVTSIGYSAFRRCETLETINMPKNIQTIQRTTFQECRALKSIEIPNSVTKIENGAFSQCTGLTEINMPNSITELEDQIFSGCTNLTTAHMSKNITKMGPRIFKGCEKLTHVDMPENATYTGAEMFALCKSLETIELPDNITTIELRTFQGCTALKSIKMPNNVTKIGSDAFKNCTALKNIEIPNSVTEIRTGAFQNCTSIDDISIPDSVTTIEGDAFFNVKHITYNGEATYSPNDTYWGALSMN